MKRIFITLFISLIATVAIQAQQISVVNSNGETTLYSTLADAIEGADPGSVIYLPGGGFPISDDVKITKKLTIIGIGHKIDTDNVDGYTTISGNIFFNQGSDNSALMGVYVAGNVYVGDDGNAVNDVLIRYCNIGSLYVKSSKCLRTNVNQNYIRQGSFFTESNAIVSNNVVAYIDNLDDGFIFNNIVTRSGANGHNSLHLCDRTSITNNIIFPKGVHDGSDCLVSGNMVQREWGEECINMSDVDWNDVFKNYNNATVSPTSNFHFKEDYAEYEHKVGIYAGDGFNDDQMAPVPYIISKRVDEHTDTSGKLNIKIRVKAGQ